MPLRVYNTLTQTKEPFQTVQPGKVGMYVCGPTVYSPSHIGHMVGPVIFDTIKRYLVYLGYEVTWVVNITDVDDKLIVQAQKDGTTVHELAERVTRDYLDCLAALGVDGIDHMPRATEHIGEIIAINQALDRQGIRVRVGRRRLLRRRQGARIRQAQPPRPRRAAGRRADRALVDQASSRRLRPVEALEARRAVVGEPLGAGPAGLAHRMLGHEHEVPGPPLRHPRRRPRPGLPPPRERAGPVRVVHRRDRSPRTGCTTAC